MTRRYRYTDAELEMLLNKNATWNHTVISEPEGEEIESTLQKKAERWCKDHGYPFLSFRQSKYAQRMLPAGWPDMIIILFKKVFL